MTPSILSCPVVTSLPSMNRQNSASMLMQNVTNLVVPTQLSQSLVLSRTKDLSSPLGLIGFFSFCFPGEEGTRLKPYPV